jgi:hypothetical protein
MINYKIGSVEDQYNVFDEAFQTDKANFKHPTYLYRYFELYYNMYTSENHSISLEELIKKYEAINEKFDGEKQRLSRMKSDSAYKNSIGIANCSACSSGSGECSGRFVGKFPGFHCISAFHFEKGTYQCPKGYTMCKRCGGHHLSYMYLSQYCDVL